MDKKISVTTSPIMVLVRPLFGKRFISEWRGILMVSLGYIKSGSYLYSLYLGGWKMQRWQKVCFRPRATSLFQRGRTALRLVSDIAISSHLSTRSTSRSLVTNHSTLGHTHSGICKFFLCIFSLQSMHLNYCQNKIKRNSSYDLLQFP